MSYSMAFTYYDKYHIILLTHILYYDTYYIYTVTVITLIPYPFLTHI